MSITIRERRSLKKSRTLREYSIFIQKIRNKKRNMSIEEAVEETVSECLDEGILYEFLKKNGGDIMDFINIELTREECEAIRENDGYERGLQEGMLEEQQVIAKRMKLRDMDITEISDITGLSTKEIEKL